MQRWQINSKMVQISFSDRSVCGISEILSIEFSENLTRELFDVPKSKLLKLKHNKHTRRIRL